MSNYWSNYCSFMLENYIPENVAVLKMPAEILESCYLYYLKVVICILCRKLRYDSTNPKCYYLNLKQL